MNWVSHMVIIWQLSSSKQCLKQCKLKPFLGPWRPRKKIWLQFLFRQNEDLACVSLIPYGGFPVRQPTQELLSIQEDEDLRDYPCLHEVLVAEIQPMMHKFCCIVRNTSQERITCITYGPQGSTL